MVAQVSTLLQEVVRLSSKLMEREAALPNSLPTDPVELSYWVASHFHGAPRDRQALLEMVSTEARLRREAEILESACKHLAARTALKDLFSRVLEVAQKAEQVNVNGLASALVSRYPPDPCL